MSLAMFMCSWKSPVAWPESQNPLATEARSVAVVHLLDEHPMFCSRQTINIRSTEIFRITGALRTRDCGLPIRTDRRPIEEGKQLRCAADVDCGAGRFCAGRFAAG